MDYCYKFSYLSLKFDLFSIEQKHRISQLSYTLREKVFPFGFFSLPYFSSLDSPLLVFCIPSYLLHSEEKTFHPFPFAINYSPYSNQKPL